MSAQDDRPTPPDPHRPAKPPRPGEDAPGSQDAERLKREAVSALRRVGADRARLEQRRETPKGLQVPHRATLHDGAPPPSESLPPSSGNADAATIAALRAELDAYRTGRKNSPPRGIPAQSGHISGQPAKTEVADDEIDRTTGKLLRLLVRRYWFQGALALGVAAVAFKPAAAPEKVDAGAARIEALEAKWAALQESHAAVLKREASKDQLIKCLHEQDAERFEQLFPAKDRAGSALLPQPWTDKCAHFKLP